jgi:hypothetical protein
MGRWTLRFRAMAPKIAWLKPARYVFMGSYKSIVYATAVNGVVEGRRRIRVNS